MFSFSDTIVSQYCFQTKLIIDRKVFFIILGNLSTKAVFMT